MRDSSSIFIFKEYQKHYWSSAMTTSICVPCKSQGFLALTNVNLYIFISPKLYVRYTDSWITNEKYQETTYASAN